MNTSFTAVDFETATNDRMACQIGMVVVRNGEIVDRIVRLIQPPYNKYDANTIAVHRITPEQTKCSPTFDTVWEEIKDHLTNTLVVAHNAQFDEDVLNRNLFYYGIPPMGVLPFECTCNLFHRTGLHDLCEAFGMSTDGHHDALFDAECCAQFYLKYLNGVRPDYSLITNQKSKYERLAAKMLKGDILKKDLSQADPNNPFYDRKVVITGEFSLERKELAKKLKAMGADIDTAITKKTNYVLVGSAPGPAKMDKIEKLIHDGFNIRKLSQSDIDAIFLGDWEGYHAEKEVKKDLSLTYEHFLKHHITFELGYNIIASKELYYGNGFKGNFDLFNQITGNMGAAGDLEIYPETNICVLSDSTLDKLQKGEKDETILYIENYYNRNRSITFDFEFISESEILNYCKERCEQCGDEVTMELYEKYIESAINDIKTESNYKFKKGENYCKVNGKIVLKLDDGRTWCPSRQFR